MMSFTAMALFQDGAAFLGADQLMATELVASRPVKTVPQAEALTVAVCVAVVHFALVGSCRPVQVAALGVAGHPVPALRTSIQQFHLQLLLGEVDHADVPL